VESDTYAFFKDFAGSIATIFAAAVAAIVTFYFNRRQTAIAASQRDIARDKLKVDLFQQRYKIYSVAKLLLEKIIVFGDRDDVVRGTNEIRDFYVTLDEARFFFDPDVCRLLETLHDNAEAFLTDLSADVNVDDPKAWSARAERLAKKQAVLRQMYADLPKRFENALGFAQLTQMK